MPSMYPRLLLSKAENAYLQARFAPCLPPPQHTRELSSRNRPPSCSVSLLSSGQKMLYLLFELINIKRLGKVRGFGSGQESFSICSHYITGNKNHPLSEGLRYLLHTPI